MPRLLTSKTICLCLILLVNKVKMKLLPADGCPNKHVICFAISCEPYYNNKSCWRYLGLPAISEGREKQQPQCSTCDKRKLHARFPRPRGSTEQEAGARQPLATPWLDFEMQVRKPVYRNPCLKGGDPGPTEKAVNMMPWGRLSPKQFQLMLPGDENGLVTPPRSTSFKYTSKVA